MTNQTQSPIDMNKALFLNLVTMLSMSAMQQMGKIINPMTGKTEVNLEGVQTTIDMLDMLEAKSRGNRDADEDKVLKDTLTMLKMNYVETSKAEPQKEEVRDQRSAVSEKKEGPPKEAQKPARQSQEQSDVKGGSDGKNDQEKTGGPGDNASGGQGNSKETGADKTTTKDPKFHKSYE